MKNVTIVVAVMLLVSPQLSAQILEKEVIFDLDKKEARTAAILGYPNDIVVDDANGRFELVYVTKAKNKYLRKNRLIFDYDLNHLETITDEIDVEGDYEDVPTVEIAQTHPNFRGERFVQTSLQLNVGLTSNKLEKTEVTYTYDWQNAKYNTETEVLAEMKTKELMGKLTMNPYAIHWNDAVSGDLIYVSGIVTKTFGTDGYKIRRVTPDMVQTELEPISFDYVQKQFYGGWVTNSDGTSDLIMIYAAAGGKGVYKPKVNASPEVNDWTYVRLSPTGEIKHRASFKTKVHNWDILGSVLRDGSVYVYGPGETKGVNDELQPLMGFPGTGKQDAFQIIKATGDNIDFVAGPTLDEMNAVAAKPADQKKLIEYDGRKVEFRNFNFSSNGDMFISAQDYSKDARSTKPLYKDFFLFHFAADGSFKRLYGLESVKDKAGIAGAIDPNTDPRFYPDEGEVFQGSDGTMYWNIYGVKRVDKYVSSWTSGGYEYTEITWIPRLTGAIAKFDVASGTVDDVKELGNGDFTLYRIPSIGTPSIAIEGGAKRIYIGNGGEKGRQIWLGKIDPAQL
ncbi:MAG: hypothetical protein RIF33_10625 [Cyclobacteriaceae bacterium]